MWSNDPSPPCLPNYYQIKWPKSKRRFKEPCLKLWTNSFGQTEKHDQIWSLICIWILEISRCFLESVFLNLLWHMRPVGCHKFAQEITVYVISMANLRHNHEAMNKMNIIQVANLHLHCWSGEQTKFQGKHTLE
jgi:hypothetical protein